MNLLLDGETSVFPSDYLQMGQKIVTRKKVVSKAWLLVQKYSSSVKWKHTVVFALMDYSLQNICHQFIQYFILY